MIEDTPLTRFDPDEIVAGLEGNWCDYLRAFAGWSQVELQDDARLFWYITGLPGNFNAVMRARLAAADVSAAIAAVRARFQARRVPLAWLVGPHTRPADLDERLRAHGFDYAGDATGMAADLYNLPPAPSPLPNLTITRVTGLHALDTWNRTEAAGFEVTPVVADGLAAIRRAIGVGDDLPLQHYLGSLDGLPVATGSVVYGSGVAGLYDIATIPAARRRGVAAAMTTALLDAARARGYRAAVLQPTEDGFGVYQRLGFESLCSFAIYTDPLDRKDLPA